jgi:hypothetical protein
MKALRVLLVLGMALGALQADPPKVYRWKDAKGREHITNTPPPEGAEELGLPSAENRREAPQPGKTTVIAEAPPAPSAPRVAFTPQQEARWREVESRLTAARRAQDRTQIDALADALITEARWGRGLRLLLVLPIALGALLTLLGWWLGLGLARPLPQALLAGGLLLGLLSAQATLALLIHRRQALRLQAMVIGLSQVPSIQPEGLNRLQAQAERLADHAALTTAPWRFGQAVDELAATLRDALHQP